MQFSEYTVVVFIHGAACHMRVPAWDENHAFIVAMGQVRQNFPHYSGIINGMPPVLEGPIARQAANVSHLTVVEDD